MAAVPPIAEVPPALFVPPVPEELEDVPEQAVIIKAVANNALALGLDEVISTFYHLSRARK